MNSLFMTLAAKFINADTIGGYVRNIVAAGFAALLAWKGGWLLPFLTPELQTAVTALIVGVVVGGWGQIAKNVTAPTETQVVKVIQGASDAGVVSPALAAKVTADPTIAMPDKAVGNI